ncbi:MAG: glycosyl hydrolase, partial [Gemmatimonadales bacterium]|nr:glycosyl hydrolase [Gemmatimonadales bacterium]
MPSPCRLLMFGAALSALLLLPNVSQAQVDPSLFQSMSYRNIGPFRGGRVTTVTGIPGQTYTFYMGATGGGVWKTTDAGTTWQNISDGYFNTTGIGAITVAPSDQNVVYVGTGESPVRGVKTSHGDGVYKSTDAGETWTHMGLEPTRHISRIIVDPNDPDRVYVAAQGNPWGPNAERGIYLSEDGGETWDKILYVNEDSGIVDLTVDAANPNFMMATSWDFRRKPWVVKSGGPGSRVHKTTDGGETWTEINAGLPDLKGKMGIAISPANSRIVYMAIEAGEGQGGVYRSDNAGETFR